MSSVAAVAARKAELRAAALARRDALAPDLRVAAAEAIAARPLPVAATPQAIVSGFMPIKSEINPLPLLRRFAAAGARLALPAIVGRGRPLAMRAWTVGDKLVAGQWGIREPQASAAEVHPDVVLVPLVAFDRRGHRIGYGAGYYDMTIAGLRQRKPMIAIGVAYAVQEVGEVPALPHDARLDLVLTEKEAIECRGA
jgi:5-formyltetrahydrofolate cyclo-ligase